MKAFFSITILSVLLSLGTPLYAGGLLDERELLTYSPDKSGLASKASLWQRVTQEGGILFTVSEWIQFSWNTLTKLFTRQVWSSKEDNSDRLPAKTDTPNLICKKCSKLKSSSGLFPQKENLNWANGLEDEKLTN